MNSQLNTMEIVHTVEAEQAGKDAESASSAVLKQTSALIVTTEAEYQLANEGFVAAKRLKKSVKAQLDDLVGPLKDTIKKLEQPFRKAMEELDVAIARYESPMAAFQRRQLEERQVAERAAREEAERQRRALEEQAKAEERRLLDARQREREALERAQASEDPIDALLAESDAQQASQEAQEALAGATDAYRSSAVIKPEEMAVPRVTAAGSRVNTYWKARVVDVAKVPDEFWIIDEAKLARHAREHKDAASIPGVEFYADVKIGGA